MLHEYIVQNITTAVGHLERQARHEYRHSIPRAVEYAHVTKLCRSVQIVSTAQMYSVLYSVKQVCKTTCRAGNSAFRVCMCDTVSHALHPALSPRARTCSNTSTEYLGSFIRSWPSAAVCISPAPRLPEPSQPPYASSCELYTSCNTNRKSGGRQPAKHRQPRPPTPR